jgi:hypothetical protein
MPRACWLDCLGSQLSCMVCACMHSARRCWQAAVGQVPASKQARKLVGKVWVMQGAVAGAQLEYGG